MSGRLVLGRLILGWGLAATSAVAEVPTLEAAVAEGRLPALAARLPAQPRVVDLAGSGRAQGRYGAELRLLVSRAQDVRLMVVYGYARLVVYTPQLELVPDILREVEVEGARRFTLLLRRGHRWSDGEPFTSEAFRYYWEDIANHPELSPFGLETDLLVDGRGPHFEILDEHAVRFTWDKPNPRFLPALAGARPLYVYAPAHYLKRFHRRYTDDPQALDALARAEGQRNWAALHNARNSPYRNRIADAPTLQPWVNRTEGPAQRISFTRNPYFHRVDESGQQLPYIDRVTLLVIDGQLIPAKAGAGEADLQARGLGLADYPFLKRNEERSRIRVRLWRTTKGAHIALYPNLNVADPVWRKLVRERSFRRALSLGVDRREINQVVYFGLASEGNNTVHASSPLFRPQYRERWGGYDPDEANRLLDALGLPRRSRQGLRVLPDGRPLEIVVETAGESVEQVDVLELIRDSWRRLGIALFIKPLQREVLRNRVFSGQTLVSVWGGLENGAPTPAMSPHELAPTAQIQLQWPRWGQWYQTRGLAGEPPDLPAAETLLRHYEAWADADAAGQTALWHEMLAIHAEEVFTIGVIGGVPQPVVSAQTLRNLPQTGVYNWHPGAHFGVYEPAAFWFDVDPAPRAGG